MAGMPPEFVDTPTPRPLRYGLLTVAAGPLTLPDHAVAAGVQYIPDSCGGAELYAVNCSPASINLDPGDGPVVAQPFLAVATYLCSPVGLTFPEVERRVLNRLASGEQSVAEQGLAAVLAAHATPLSTTAYDSDRMTSVVGELEQWLYGSGGAGLGHTGFIHAPFRALGHAARSGLIVDKGNQMQTRLGTTWVFGDYPDNGTVYITGQVTVWREAQPTVPPPAQTFDPINNQIKAVAQRVYAVAYECAAASAVYIEGRS